MLDCGNCVVGRGRGLERMRGGAMDEGCWDERHISISKAGRTFVAASHTPNNTITKKSPNRSPCIRTVV